MTKRDESTKERLALRDAGRDPDEAQVRSPDVVESYKG